MSDLTSGQQKIVEIAKALVFKSNVIILDEPTASFSSREIDTVLDIVKTVKKDGIASSTFRITSTRSLRLVTARPFCATAAK